MFLGFVVAVAFFGAYKLAKYEIDTHRNTTAENVEAVSPELQNYRRNHPVV